jgi:hypothetical protein
MSDDTAEVPRLPFVLVVPLSVLALAPIVYLTVTMVKAMDGELSVQPALHLTMTLLAVAVVVTFAVLILRDSRLEGQRLPWILALFLVNGVAGVVYLAKYQGTGSRRGPQASEGRR